MTEAVETGAAVEDVEAPSTETAEEAPAAESTSETAEAKPEESPSKDEAEGDDVEPKEWVNLVEKCDGDKAKIGETWWRANNEAARFGRENKALSKENADLRIKLRDFEGKSPQKPESPAEKPITEHPSIQKLESEITALDSQLVALREDGTKHIAKLNAHAETVAGLKYSIKEAGELATDDQKARLALAEERLETLRDQFDAKREKYQEKEQRLNDAKARRDTVRTEAEAERARQKRADEGKARFNEEFPQQIDTLIIEKADDLGIPDDAEIREDLWDVVNTYVMHQLWRAAANGNPDISEVDHEELVKARIERYAKVHGLAKKAAFADASRGKATVTPHKIVPGTPLIPAKTAPKPRLLQVGEPADPKLAAARTRLAKMGW